MTWTVETLGAIVDAEIEALPKDMQASFLRLAECIEVVGLERIGAPHVKHLQDKLWEMRLADVMGSPERSTSPQSAVALLWCMRS
jgi:Phage derived protein Gp49-like (DUF891)